MKLTKKRKEENNAYLRLPVNAMEHTYKFNKVCEQV